MTIWHQKTIPDVIEQLDSDSARGLTNDQVALRVAKHGPNELIEMGGRGPWRILWEQLSGAMVVMLIVAAGVSAVLHEYTDAVVIKNLSTVLCRREPPRT
jgi:Ca2+-transporting ATPase